MSVQRLKVLFILKKNANWTLGGLKLTRETPPGECGRKVKLKGIDGDWTRGGDVV